MPGVGTLRAVESAEEEDDDAAEREREEKEAERNLEVKLSAPTLEFPNTSQVQEGEKKKNSPLLLAVFPTRCRSLLPSLPFSSRENLPLLISFRRCPFVRLVPSPQQPASTTLARTLVA
jgi:hypothetical protein